jgi:hypothetical protein
MNIKDLKVGNTIYMQKLLPGTDRLGKPDHYRIELICEYQGVIKGLVIGKVIQVIPNWYEYNFKDTIIKTLKKNCYIRAERIFIDETKSLNSCYWLNPKSGEFE